MTSLKDNQTRVPLAQPTIRIPRHREPPSSRGHAVLTAAGDSSLSGSSSTMLAGPSPDCLSTCTVFSLVDFPLSMPRVSLDFRKARPESLSRSGRIFSGRRSSS